MRACRAWLLGTLALAGCGLSAAAVGGLVGGVASVVATGATVYVETLPSATPTPSPTPTSVAPPAVAASATPTPAAH